MAKSVFFSYAREDRDCVAYVAESVRSAGFTTFFDQDILGGQQWWDRLLTKIEECDVFIPVLSAAYLRSVPCRIEVSYAVELGKTLLPLDLSAGGLPNTVFIEPIKAAQWIQYNSGERASTVLNMIGSLNRAPTGGPLPAERVRPAAPGADVLSTTVRLVGSPNDLTETEQWAVVGELRANLRGENRAAAQALLGSFLARRDLLATVYNDATSMVPESPEPREAPRHKQAPPGPDPVPPPDSADSRSPQIEGKPKTYRAWSIAMVVIGAPFSVVGATFGVIALIYSNQVSTKWRAGDGGGARYASRRARLWNLIGVVVLVVVLFLLVSEA